MRPAFQIGKQWTLLRVGASATAMGLALVAAMILMGSTVAQAQAAKRHGHSPLHIRSEKADLIDSPAPAATAKFGCETRFFDPSLNGGRVPCYGPSAIRSAYGLNGLLNKGFTGKGGTIVILDAYGSPTALSDLQAFDTVFGLPDPPSFSVVEMPGTPVFDPTDDNQVGWAEEVSLDVQWSHAIAPSANIILVAAKSNDDTDLVAGLNYALDNHLGDVVSMSFGETELELTDTAGLQVLNAWELAFKHARENHVTLFVSSADNGSDTGGLMLQNASYPASSPQVTSVGGTNLFFGIGPKADPNGAYEGEVVWNDGFGAGGGGISLLFAAPDYQKGLAALVRPPLRKERGVPDVAYNAGVVGGVIVHLGFGGIPAGYYVFGGTSAGAPQWAGLITDINQLAGHPAGFINDRLYALGRHGKLPFRDVVNGNNAFGGVEGFSAGPGYDLATGWGTPNFAKFRANDWDRDGDDDGE